MEKTQTLIIGAGISGLSTAAALGDADYLVIDSDCAIGGYCKTTKQDGFVWDYSGHFFHFKNADIEAWLRERMQGQQIITCEKKSFVAYGGDWIDFPFQKNIHQLPKADFIDCLHDLYFANSIANEEGSFLDMVYGRFGKSISEKFLVPYNEKLYACDLALLDKDAMGRFFPHADVDDVVRNMKTPDNQSYNASFTYPQGGAIEYVNAIASAVRPDAICLNEALVGIDLERKVARTLHREIAFERLVSSAPFNRLAQFAGLDHNEGAFTWNKVMVFNLGFDSKGPSDVHWVYYPDRDLEFYRVGFYDNIFDTDRMSLYVEVGLSRDAEVNIDGTLARVLDDLAREGLIVEHELVSHHALVMDPAYVHINQQARSEVDRLNVTLNAHGVHPIGRYGRWTYCSIEDNMIEARELVASWQEV
jgi:protoporphyrinogen oxidase